jgi:hypothetical protein
MGPQRQTPVFCISLKDSQRRHSFASGAGRNNVLFEFFDGVTIDDVRTGFCVPGCHLGQRFHGSNHIRQPRRDYRTRCG